MRERINDSKLVDDYFRWLCELVGLEDPVETTSYKALMKQLYSTEFYWTVPNDDNRSSDGIDLRGKFADDNWYESYEDIDGPCKVLEMLIALAIRWDGDIMYDPDKGDRSVGWFWVLIKNLRLDKCVDEDFGDCWSNGDVDHILTRFMDRDYKRNGIGGLFPLRNFRVDQRKVEIWYQMSAYILENFNLKT